MNFKKKLVALVLSVMTVISMSVCAFAAEDGLNTIDGVTIKTETDKDTYISGDTAEFTITVTNNNTYDICDFSISYDVPMNFDISTADMPKTIDFLAAGESTTLKFETVVTSNTEAPATFPTTTVIIVAVVVVVVILVVVFILMSKKKKKQSSALMLVGALLAGTLASMQVPQFEAKAEEVKNADYRRVSVHDPSIVKDPETGYYYVFGSHKAYAKSKDMISWETFSMNLTTDYKEILGDVWENYCFADDGNPATALPDLNGNLWAPDVIYNETMGKWCMYLSVNGSNWQSAIVLLTADNIEGPYEYVDGIIYSGFFDYSTFGNESTAATLNQERANYSNVYEVLGEGADLTRYSKSGLALINAIDPDVIYDNEGNLWMTYGSWSGGIYQVKLDNATGLRDNTYTYETKTNVSDAYLGYKISGGCYNSGEGPYILATEDYYYLFVSIGNLETSGGYNMRIYRSESINGPYVDEDGNSAITTSWQSDLGFKQDSGWSITSKYTSKLGIKLMGAYDMYGISKVQAAQGHNSAFVDDDGKMYVVYHTRFAGSGEGHEVRVHQLFQTETGWITAAPYEYSKETLSTEGYKAEDVAGTYDFVLQRKDLVYANNASPNEGAIYWMNTYKTITINSEEVSLGIRADWSESAGKVTDSKGVVFGQEMVLNADGTIGGDYTGTWEMTEGANVKMTIDGTEYSGVFIEQQNELSTRDMTMCFTLVGGNHCAWGVYNPEAN